MSVSCSGRSGVLEQLGEKQDFEAELSRGGFTHEAFALHVDAGPNSDSGAAWDPRYKVTVTHAPTQTVKLYQAGPRENWVARFSKDLVGGLFGEPSLRRPLDIRFFGRSESSRRR